MGKLQKRWIDTVNKCLKKKNLDVRQPRRMVDDRSEWQGIVRGNAWNIVWGGIFDFNEILQLYEVLEGWKSVCG